MAAMTRTVTYQCAHLLTATGKHVGSLNGRLAAHMTIRHGLNGSCGCVGCGSCLLVRMAAMQQAPVCQAAAGAEQQQQQRSQGARHHPPAGGSMVSSREDLASVSVHYNA